MKQGFKKLTHRKDVKSCTESGFIGYNATSAVNAFYAEIKNVDFNNLVWEDGGHFMNMIDKTIGIMGAGCTPNTVAMHT